MPALPQKFGVSLNGTAYNITLHWCDPAACWILDLADQNNNPLITGIPLVTGLSLLGQYGYVGVPGDMFVQTDTDAFEVPTVDSLGLTSHLYFAPLAAP